jgi:hypothetical protein
MLKAVSSGLAGTRNAFLRVPHSNMQTFYSMEFTLTVNGKKTAAPTDYKLFFAVNNKFAHYCLLCAISSPSYLQHTTVSYVHF